jgi:GntR family transcriptional regulator
MALDIVRGDSPLFRRISSALAEAIGRGDYPVGGPLPTEMTLMRMFGASRFTIREALAELRLRGLIASRRGLGSIVLRVTPPDAEFSETHQSIEDFLAGATQAPFTALEITDVVADATLAAQLHCEEGRQFIKMRGERGLRDGSDAPMALVTGYLNASYGLLRPHLRAVTEALASIAEKVLNVRVKRIVRELEPTVLDADQAARLLAPVGSAAMLVRRWYYLDNDDLLLASRSIYPQGRLTFRTVLTRANSVTENVGH